MRMLKLCKECEERTTCTTRCLEALAEEEVVNQYETTIYKSKGVTTWEQRHRENKTLTYQ